MRVTGSRSRSITCLSLLACSFGVGASAGAADWLMKGISYGVSPDQGVMANDDMFNDAVRAQWGCPGRGDLSLMAELGANAVRLYGNDPRYDHSSFLDEAESLGLGVVPGISDWPYLQSQTPCTYANDWDCHDAISESYMQNLKNGFVANGTYHPGLRAMIAVNEPDLKLGSEPQQWARAVISAIDGMLSAEDKAGLEGPDLLITATVSFQICSSCEKFNDKPGLGMMWTLRDAMRKPHKYGYGNTRHDLAKFYETRFINSFNTGNPASEIDDMFLKAYSKEFRGTPVFIAEYHAPSEPTLEDLTAILKLARGSRDFLGVSFFEWMNRHDEGGHTDWGIFNLGVAMISTMDYAGAHYDVANLVPAKDKHGETVPVAIAKAYSGSYSARPMCGGTYAPTTTATTITTTATTATATTTTATTATATRATGTAAEGASSRMPQPEGAGADGSSAEGPPGSAAGARDPSAREAGQPAPQADPAGPEGGAAQGPPAGTAGTGDSPARGGETDWWLESSIFP